MKFRLRLAVALLLAAPAFAHAEPTVAGFWERQDKDGNPSAWFFFSAKGDMFSGRVVKGFKKPDDDTSPPEICAECPGDKKGAHTMGLTLVWDMKRNGLEYRGGRVLDPRNGDVWRAQMNLSEDGKNLEFRGYLGVSMLGKSETWRRLPDDAMKKDDMPKEILAGGPVEADKHKTPADKSKPHKPKVEEPADAEAAPADAKPQ